MTATPLGSGMTYLNTAPTHAARPPVCHTSNTISLESFHLPVPVPVAVVPVKRQLFLSKCHCARRRR